MARTAHLTATGGGGGRLDRAALAQLAAAVLLLGAGWPVTRYALLQGAGAGAFALGRAGLSARAAAGLLALSGRLRAPARQDWPTVLAVGLLQLGAFFAFAHLAVAVVPAGRVAILANCTAIFAVPLSVLLLGEQVGRRRWLATLLSAAGVAVLTGPWAISWSAPGVLEGHAELLAAAASWTGAILIMRRWPPRSPMLRLLPSCFLLGAAALLPLALLHPLGHWNGRALACLAGIGLLVSPAGTLCIMEAQSRLPVVVASVGLLAGPALGVLLGVAFLGEPFGPDMLLGAICLIGGAALAATGGGR